MVVGKAKLTGGRIFKFQKNINLFSSGYVAKTECFVQIL